MDSIPFAEEVLPFTVNKKTSRRNKIVYQFDLDGTLLNVFPSVEVASEQTGIGKPTIYQCCTGVQNYTRGYRWSYDRNTMPMFRKICQYKDGRLFNTFKNLKKACVSAGINAEKLNTAIKTGQPCHGFIWKRE